MNQIIVDGKAPEKIRLFGLDHLRAVAIGLVFLYHYGRLFPHPDWTNTISIFGWTGVDLFFVLSGYLISAQLFSKIEAQKPISFKSFFIKRFFRIIPAYLLVVALYFMIPFCREREGLAPLWKYLSFMQNFGLDLRSQGTFSHAWSLCIEEQFYLFLPLTLMILLYFKAMKKSRVLLILLFIISFIARICTWQIKVLPFIDNNDSWAYWYKWIYYPTFCRLDGLLVGVTVAAFFKFYPNIKMQLFKYVNIVFWISLLTLILAYFICMDQETFVASIFGFPLVSVGYGLMVIYAICPKTVLFKTSSTVTTTIATLSYSIYLTHKIIIHITQDYFSKFQVEKDSNSMFLICIVTSLLGAMLVNKLVEKPFLKLRGRFVKT